VNPLWLRISRRLAVGAAFVALWETGVRLSGVAVYILPAPSDIARSLVTTDRASWLALGDAADHPGGARRRRHHRRADRAGFFAVAHRRNQLFPVRGDPPGDADRRDRAADYHLGAHTVPGAADLRVDRRVLPDRLQQHVGLNSADRNLLALFRLYGASRWQVLWLLRVPTALPYFLAGLRISGGLALIGAVVAEFVAAPAAPRRASPTASSKPATAWRSRASSRRCSCCR